MTDHDTTLDQLQAGDLVCSNCGEPWPGTYSGFWLKHNGGWFHWCSGGRPGLWHMAILNGGGDGAEERAQRAR
jgi:hypothetical protein